MGKYVKFPINDDISLEVWEDNDKLELSTIVIPKSLRGQGKGTEIMNMVIKYANKVNKPLYLTPDTSFGGTSINRLKNFYKRFGFVKNKDYEVSHSMVKYPQINTKNKKEYIGQCDVLRRKCEENEEYWQMMMKNKKKINFKKFIDGVNMEKLLEDDETPIGFINDAVREDSSTSTYVSNWGDKETYFLQTAGFEFIFV